MENRLKNNKIKELRQEKGLSQRGLAAEIGTKQANISRWEAGLVVPSAEECWTLADFFAVSVDYLIGRSDY